MKLVLNFPSTQLPQRWSRWPPSWLSKPSVRTSERKSSHSLTRLVSNVLPEFLVGPEAAVLAATGGLQTVGIAVVVGAPCEVKTTRGRRQFSPTSGTSSFDRMLSSTASIVELFLIPLAVLIIYHDVRYRRIPNPIVLATLISGLAINFVQGGFSGGLDSITGSG